MNAIELRKLYEQRNALLEKMNTIVNKAVGETRAMTEDENNEYEAAKAEVQALATTITAAEEERGIIAPPAGGTDDVAAKEERAFRAYIESSIHGASGETRAAASNINKGDNGAIIPTTIANRIIKTIKEISPIVGRATMFIEKGNLKIPAWGDAENGDNITADYADEFTELTEHAGKFTAIELKGYLMGALVLIGKSVINSSTFDLVGFVVSEMAMNAAEFFEKEALNGTPGKAHGALETSNVHNASRATSITADELIELQAKIHTAYQSGAIWVMHPDTFTSLRELKDQNQRYLMQDDITKDFPYRMLGKPVFLSDNMPKMEAGKKAVLYGDPKGLAFKLSEAFELQLLVEKYATQHAVGLVGWAEFDCAVMNHQMLAALEMAAS